MPKLKPLEERIDYLFQEFGEPLHGSGEESKLGDVDFTPLHNQHRKRWEPEKETPRHRNALHLKVQGYTNEEIAERTGFHSQYLPYLFQASWALEYMAKLRDKSFAQKVEVMLKEAVAPAVSRLIVEMDNPNARSSERTSAANAVLDRLFGRAAQPIIHAKSEDPRKMTDAEIQERLAQLKGTTENRS